MSSLKPRTFDSNIIDFGPFMDREPAQDVIKAEPMFFNSSVAFGLERGGPVTRAFLRSLPGVWDGAVFDSRIHMLMPGWYPAIPGWHHDDVPRPPIPVGQHFATAGQPDYETPRYHAEHIMGLANGTICPTQFALGKAHVPAVPEGDLIYRTWHPVVESRIKQGELELLEAPSLHMIYFDWQTFHQGRKSTGNGWRWFGRVTRNSDRCKEITNEIRHQVQVYLEFPMEGW